jgi:large subunit ribosomal protein L5
MAEKSAFSGAAANRWIFDFLMCRSISPLERAITEYGKMARLQEKYQTQLVGEIQQKLGLKNSMQVPRITKITLNMGVGQAIADKKVMEHARADMEKISGQVPVTCLARKSVASFKIRDGYPIGCKVTLRRERMYEFLDRLVNIAIPRIRDFRGLNPRSFDRQGNYSIGVSEQIIFPEINYDEIDALRGMDITITTTARNAKEGRALLEAFNFPFKK